MTHRTLALLTVAAVLLVVGWRSYPEADQRSPFPTCPHPFVVSVDGARPLLHCADRDRISAWELAAVLGAKGCSDHQWLSAGDQLTLDGQDPCGLRVTKIPAALLLTVGLPLDLNRSSADDLRVLPGIGPVLARRIVDDRARRGPFPALDAIRRVRGIGPKTVQRLRGLATVELRESPVGVKPACRDE